MKRSEQHRPSGKPTPIRFSTQALQEIEETAKLLSMSKQDIIRLSCAAGLRILRRLGHTGLADLIAKEDGRG